MSRVGALLLAVALSSLASAKAIRPTAGALSRKFPDTNYSGASSGPALPLFSLLAPSSTDQSSTADLCDTYSSSMTGAYWCLRGNGTGTGAALTATGSPTTETRSYCGNGDSCGSVTGQQLSASKYYSLAAAASPAGSWSVCAAVLVTSTSAIEYVVTKSGGGATVNFMELRLNGTSIEALVGNGTSQATLASATAATSKAAHHVCVTYSRTGGAADNVQKIYLDGVQTATTSTALLTSSSVASAYGWQVGRRSDGQGAAVTVRNAFATETVLSAATILAMSNTALGKLIPATGQTLTFARTTSKACTNTAGSEVTWLQPNRPCVTQGGVSIEAAATNLVQRNEEFDNVYWTSSASVTNPTVTANSADKAAPDGTFSAEKVDFPSVAVGGHFSLKQSGGLTFTAVAYSQGLWLSTLSGTAEIVLEVSDGITRQYVLCSVTSTWARCKNENRTQTATGGGIMRFGVTTETLTSGGSPAQTAKPAQTVYAWSAGVELGAFVSSPIVTTSAAVTRTAETMTAPNPLLGNPASWCMGATADPDGNWALASTRSLLFPGTVNAANSAHLKIEPAPKFVVFDGAGNSLTREFSSVALDSASHRLVGASASGTLTALLDGVAGGTNVGTGTGIVTTQGATMHLGTANSGGASPLNGLLSNVRLDSTTSGCN